MSLSNEPTRLRPQAVDDVRRLQAGSISTQLLTSAWLVACLFCRASCRHSIFAAQQSSQKLSPSECSHCPTRRLVQQHEKHTVSEVAEESARCRMMQLRMVSKAATSRKRLLRVSAFGVATCCHIQNLSFVFSTCESEDSQERCAAIKSELLAQEEAARRPNTLPGYELLVTTCQARDIVLGRAAMHREDLDQAGKAFQVQIQGAAATGPLALGRAAGATCRTPGHSQSRMRDRTCGA